LQRIAALYRIEAAALPEQRRTLRHDQSRHAGNVATGARERRRPRFNPGGCSVTTSARAALGPLAAALNLRHAPRFPAHDDAFEYINVRRQGSPFDRQVQAGTGLRQLKFGRLGQCDPTEPKAAGKNEGCSA
jgi:hypothetical protein